MRLIDADKLSFYCNYEGDYSIANELSGIIQL